MEIHLPVSGYTDVSFQSDRDDSESQSGYVITLNGGTVSWKSPNNRELWIPQLN